MKRLVTASLLLPLALRSPPLGASDHLDGPATTRDRVTDLTDLYAFPTPNRPGFLTVILDAYPAVAPEGHFSDKVDYTLYLRRATVRTGDRTGYREIERAVLAGTEHQGCGGRKPTDDVMDTIFGLYTGGLSGPPICDGVDSPGPRVLDAFPWVAPQDEARPGAIKTRLANTYLRSRD